MRRSAGGALASSPCLRLGRRRRRAGRPNAADDTDESAGHEREPQERHAHLESVHGQVELLLLGQRERSELDRAADADDVHGYLVEPRSDVHLLHHSGRPGAQYISTEQHRHGDDARRHDTAHDPGALGGREGPLAGHAELDPVDR